MFWGESSINMKPLQWCPRTVCGLNLAKPNQIVAALERLAPDLIVNPAAYTAVDRAEAERELTFLANAKAPAVIAHTPRGGKFHWFTSRPIMSSRARRRPLARGQPDGATLNFRTE